MEPKRCATLRSTLRISLLCVTAAASAQTFPGSAVTSLPTTPVLLNVADLNHDGHDDLIYQDTAQGGNIRILLGNGDGTFRTGQVIPIADATNFTITVGDINADGIPDMVLRGNLAGGNIVAYLGNGDGTFKSWIQSPAANKGTYGAAWGRVALADFDGDGIIDVVFCDGNSTLYFMKGDGQGDFATPVQYPSTAYGGATDIGDVYAADVNGDGIPDVVGANSGVIYVFFNRGHGVFGYPVGYTDYGGNFALYDMNGDGYLDAVTSASNGDIWVQYGGPVNLGFQPPIKIGSGLGSGGAVVGVSDLRGDGKPRVFLSGVTGETVALGATPGGYQTYAGAFAAPTVAFGNNNHNVLGDFNGDGYTDIAMPADNALAILYGQADGTFRAGLSTFTGGFIGVTGLYLIDVTGDGIPDAVMSTTAILGGNGDGTFTKLPGYDTFTVDSRMYPADLNGDGKIDLFTYETIYDNLGNGTFANAGALPFSQNFQTPFPNNNVAIGDFNHDGKPDIAEGMISNTYNVNGVEFALSGSTTQSYTYTSFSMTEVPGPLGAGDFDGDGCADLAVSGQTQITIQKSDCKGGFTQIGAYPTGYTGGQFDNPFQTTLNAGDMVVTDLDLDGHLDIVYTISGASLARVLYGHGDGTFTQGADIQLAHASQYVTAGDLDNDGYPDLVFSGFGLITILHGEANRTFSAPEYLAGGYFTGKAFLADLRRHGRLDIGIPNLGDVGNLTNEQGYSFAVFLNPLAAVNPRTVNASIKVLPEPSIIGQAFTATATFMPVIRSGTPTGTATFTLDGGSPTAGLLNASGIATATFNGATVGTHTVAVSYPGDGNFDAASASVSHVVIAAPTTLAMVCTPNPISAFGTATFTAAVSSTYGNPQGGFSFTDNGTTVYQFAGPLNGATYVDTTLTVGSHLITATFVPTGSFAGSTASCTEVVNPLPTNSVLSVNPATSTYGKSVTLTATVAPVTPIVGHTPTGMVTFYESATHQALGTASLSASGVGLLSLTTLAVSDVGITCIYSGDANFTSSSCNTVPVTVTGQASTLTLTSSLNPAPVQTAVTFTVHLALSGGGLPPVGSAVSLSLNGQAIVLTTDANGNATYTTSSLPVGSDPVTASFGGSASLLASSAALTEVIQLLPTTTTLVAAPNPTYLGQTVTLTATVPGVPVSTPTSGVGFLDGTRVLGTATLAANGQATFSVNSLAVGTHPLTAFYGANGVYAGSTSAVVQEVILPSSFTLALSPTSVTMRGGQTATAAIQLSSIGNFAGPVSLSVGALPTYATATISPVSVTLVAGGTGASTLTIKTLQHAENIAPPRPGMGPGTGPGSHDGRWPAVMAATLLLWLPLRGKRRARMRVVVGLLWVGVLVQGLTDCTNAYYTDLVVAPGSYPVTVTGTDQNGGQQSATLTVVITP